MRVLPVLGLLPFLAIPLVPALPVGPVVVAAEFQYVPEAVVVPLGTPVTFTNPAVDGVSTGHTWTTANSLNDAFVNVPNDGFDTNCAVDGELGEDADPDTCDVTLSVGASHSMTFGEPGTYVYYCQVHFTRRMVGVVHVL